MAMHGGDPRLRERILEANRVKMDEMLLEWEKNPELPLVDLCERLSGVTPARFLCLMDQGRKEGRWKMTLTVSEPEEEGEVPPLCGMCRECETHCPCYGPHGEFKPKAYDPSYYQCMSCARNEV